MNFNALLEQLIHETTASSLRLFSPELVLCGTIVVLLFARLFNCDRGIPAYWFALFGTVAAFIVVFLQFWNVNANPAEAVEMFTGLLVFDRFTVFFRLFLLLFMVLVIALTVLSGIPDAEDGPDFYTLLLGSVIGMMLMASANHLLMFFLGVEMASVPSYAMVGYLKGRRQSSEAALKFVVYGAGAAGVMLYGISLLAGLTGTADFPELATRINSLVSSQREVMGSAEVRTLVLAVLMVMVGLAFKLSVFPFHFWCPDAFEGASAEVAGYLSVASKAAAFALLVRFCTILVGPTGSEVAYIYTYLGIGVGVLAAVTATYGNLAAYVQTNMKRLLAYSTIAHAGYMLMAVSALMVILNSNLPDADIAPRAGRAVEGLLYYLAVYLFMNLAAFAIVALIRNQIFSEEIEDYRGLAAQYPVLCLCMAVSFFSLIGMPPLAGFMGKLMIFAALFDAGRIHWSMWALLVIGGLNTVFSLFYYIRVLKAMYIEPRTVSLRLPEEQRWASAYVALITLPIVGLFLFSQSLSNTAQSVVRGLFQ